ncbi:IS66-like element ISH10B family transposase [soil metagenome]
MALAPEFLQAFRSGRLTEEQAERFVDRDPLELKLLLLQLSIAVANKTSPHAPPSSVAPFDKPPPAAKRRKKSGAKPGHAGRVRAMPERIDHHVTHQLPACPDCGGELKRTGRTRKRVIEDLPADLKAEATAHTIHRDWCPCCKKQVEPVVPDALPACTLGHRAVALSAFLHYGVGTTTSQVAEVFNAHLQLKITEGGFTQMWHRLADVLKPWYEQIWQECSTASVLNADETGWHLNGVLVWLWCFCTPRSTYYAIDESRGHAALDKFFAHEFQGVLVTDFWRAYDATARMNQKCWAHLLRELRSVEDRPDGARDDWSLFAKKLRRIYTDAVRIAANEVMPQSARDSKVCALHGRVTDLACAKWTHPDARRLAKRLLTYGADLLTFVEFDGVPATNNRGEREIRPAVLMRKASYGSGSHRGAVSRAILMSVNRTLKLRGLEPLAEVQNALETYRNTGTLPPLPEEQRSMG